MAGIFERAEAALRDLQGDICDALAAVDGAASFGVDPWEREGGGGGVTRILTDGAVFEKAGVGFSSVHGELPADFAGKLPGEGQRFRAAGVSLVLHPRSPMIPTTHANVRMIEKGGRSWFGGGADLTPYYLFREDAVHFHRVLAECCDRHAPVGDYPRFKRWCDEYFYLPHRGESRGIGGIFFDYVDGSGRGPSGEGQEHAASALEGEGADLEAGLRFLLEVGRAFLGAYVPIVERRRAEPWGERERDWQLLRRGRYVEFNLLHDRGTVFGLKTGGRTESILMSLPPEVRWAYDARPEPGSREAELLSALQPVEWLSPES